MALRSPTAFYRITMETAGLPSRPAKGLRPLTPHSPRVYPSGFLDEQDYSIYAPFMALTACCV